MSVHAYCAEIPDSCLFIYVNPTLYSSLPQIPLPEKLCLNSLTSGNIFFQSQVLFLMAFLPLLLCFLSLWTPAVVFLIFSIEWICNSFSKSLVVSEFRPSQILEGLDDQILAVNCVSICTSWDQHSLILWSAQVRVYYQCVKMFSIFRAV